MDVATQWRFASAFGRDVHALRSLIRETGADVVQVAGLVNPHAAIAAAQESRAVVWQLLDTVPPMALRRLLMPVVCRLADVVTSTGRAVAEAHPGALGLGDRLVSFFPPVDTSGFRPDASARREMRAQLGVPDDAALVATLANMTPQKGFEYLVRVAVEVHSTHPDVRFRILGAPMSNHASYERGLRREIALSGLGEGGVLEIVDPRGMDLRLFYPALDVFALTSIPRSEGIPTVILEAMSCGVPVVATDVGGVREAVVDGVTGRVARSLDVPAIAAAICAVLDSRERGQAMGAAGRDRAVDLFDAQRCASVHVAAYEAAVSHRKGRHAAGAWDRARGA
jgi:glycosyltransferase involved in cell wall biosynthesis